MTRTRTPLRPPSNAHVFAFGHDVVGNAFIAFKTPEHVQYVYGMFKGRTLFGGHLHAIESWHTLGEKISLTGHPTKGNIVLVMGDPIEEITGPEADKIVAEEMAALVQMGAQAPSGVSLN